MAEVEQNGSVVIDPQVTVTANGNMIRVFLGRTRPDEIAFELELTAATLIDLLERIVVQRVVNTPNNLAALKALRESLTK